MSSTKKSAWIALSGKHAVIGSDREEVRRSSGQDNPAPLDSRTVEHLDRFTPTLERQGFSVTILKLVLFGGVVLYLISVIAPGISSFIY